MPPSRIVADGLWRCLCPSFDAIVLSKARLPLNRANPRPCSRGTIWRPRVSVSSTLSSRRQNSSIATDDLTLQGGLALADAPARGPSPSRPPKSSRGGKVKLDDMSIEELHDLLREVRDQEGAYDRIIDIVDYLIRIRGEKPGLRHFDALIRANADAERGSAEVVEGLLREMDKEGIIGDSGLYHGVMMTLAVHPNYLLRAEILEEMRARWISLSPLGHHHLLLSHLRDREYELALSLLTTMHTRSIAVAPWLYDVLIYVLCEASELTPALSLLQQRAEAPELNPLHPGPDDPSPAIWPYFLDTAAAAYSYAAVAYIWRKRVEVGYLRPSDGTLANILNTAALHADPGLATAALKMLAARKGQLPVSSYEALLEAYAVAGDVANAFRVLCIMGKAAGTSMKPPDSAATRPLFRILKEGGEEAIREAWGMLKVIQGEGQEIPVAAVNVVLEAAAFTGRLDIAMELYRELREAPSAGNKPTKRAKKTGADAEAESEAEAQKKNIRLRVSPNTTTINLLLQGCHKTGERASAKPTAMFLAGEMAALGLRPTALTYDRLILVCLREAEWEDAMRYLEEMGAMGWRGRLRTGTWQAVVRKCARERDGRVEMVLGWMEGLGGETARTGKLRREVGVIWGKADARGDEEVMQGREEDASALGDVLQVVEESWGAAEDQAGAGGDEAPVWGSLRRTSTSSASL